MRLKDGRTVEAIGPVRGDDQTLVLRLANGALVSMKAASVERISVAPARSEAGGAASEVVPAGARDRAAEPDSPPRVYGNADLPPPLLTGPAPADPPPAPDPTPAQVPQDAADPGQPQSALSYAGYVDHNGRNEQWWRDRKSQLTAELETTTQEIDRLEDEVRVAAARGKVSFGNKLGLLPLRPNQRFSSVEAGKLFTLEEGLEALKAAKARRGELQKEIDGLSEQARQAGALPGWLR